MKIKLDIVLYTLEGKPLQQSIDDKTPLTLGNVIATMLVSASQKKVFDPLKAYSLAMNIYGKKEIELDESDFSKLKDFIEGDTNFTPLVIGQILSYLEGQKE